MKHFYDFLSTLISSFKHQSKRDNQIKGNGYFSPQRTAGKRFSSRRLAGAGIGLCFFLLLIWSVARQDQFLQVAGKIGAVVSNTANALGEELKLASTRERHWEYELGAPQQHWLDQTGVCISTAKDLGHTKISLSHRSVKIDQRRSIQKVVGIHPEKDEDLEADMVFTYTDAELNGQDEKNLILYSSTDNGLSWKPQVNSVTDIETNTIRLGGIRHFSLWTAAEAPPPPDPGCIAGARLWLKANEGAYNTGMVEATQGQKINIWKNWATGANDAIPNSASQIPLLTDGAQPSAMNYNPVINTNGKYFKIPGGMVGPNTFTNLNVFAVTRTNGVTNGAILLNQTTTNNSRVATIAPWGNSLVYWQAGNTTTLGQTTPYNNSGGTYGTPYLWSFAANGTGTANQAILRNGTQLVAKNSAVTYTGSTSNTAYVGAYPGYGYFNGDIAEVMFFPTNISVADRHKIESYLAVKYGITLSHDYFASGGATTWDVGASGGFDSNITGIGRDDCSSLYQKQSRSINSKQFITIAAGTSIATSNANNSASISNDNSFLLWGDNNGSQTTTVAVVGSSNVFDRMARVWRVDKTNWADQTITFQAQGYGNRYLIIHNTSPTIGTAPDQEILLDATGTATFNSSLMPDGSYFSIGNLVKGPGRVTAGLGAWWRTDNEAYVTNWTDYSGNGFDMTGVNVPTLSPTGANFNPLMKFNSDYFTYPVGIFKNSPGVLNMKVFSVVVPVNGQYNAPWGERTSNGYNVGQWAPYTNNYTYFDSPYGHRVYTSFTGLGGVYGVPNIVGGEKSTTNLAIRLNGKVFNKPGSYNGIYVANTTANHVGAQPGRSSTGNSGVAEVIVYRDGTSLTATDIQKIESYLALKYGITLDQTTPRDYLAADGTTKMWDATANATYKYNIAGVGRDQSQLLNQKQSKSVNTGQFITFAVGNTIAATNAANTATITNDNSFFVWGDNNGSKTTVVAVSGVNVTERMSRVWRVDKTNWADQNITIQVQGYGNRYMIVHNTDPNFGSAPSQEILLDPQGKATFNSSLFPDGAYFTLGNVLQGPGCVNTGIASWFDASEMPVGAMVEGTGWTDKSGWERDMKNIGAGRDPDVQESMINFNRGAYFDGNDVVYQTSYGKTFTAGEVFSVGQAKDINNRGPMYDFGGTPTSQGGHHYPWGNSALYEGFGTNDRVGYNPTSNGITDNAPGLTVTGTGYVMTNWNLYNVGAATNDWFSGFNGLAKAVRTTNTPVFQTSSNNANGNQHIGWREGYYFYGNIAEVVHYNRKLTPAERQKVHSYLALKYGITLNQTSAYNYVATDGSVYWDASANSGFKYNIAGMGRDNCTKLDQKQSRSINAGQFITMAIGNKIEASNTANANTITNDRSFLVWGDDNGSKTTVVAVSATNVTTRMQRVWRVDKTNWGDQNITFKAQGYPNRYLLIHNTSATFATAPSQEIELDINGQATFNSSLLPDGAYFTIGAAVKGPGCVDVGVGSWWRADVDASAAGWNDYSGNEFNTTPVGTPTYNSTGANYNPYFKFFSNHFTYPVGIFKNSPGVLNMKVFSVVVPVNGQYNVPWGELTSNGYNCAQYAPYTNDYMYFDSPYGHRIYKPFSSNGGTYGIPNIVAGEKSTSNLAIRINGKVLNQPGTYNGVYTANSIYNHLGAQHGVASSGGAGLAEVIVYRDGTAMTATDIQKIESYLALKYGITLDQTTPRDYLASNGTTKMWDATVNATYKYNIAGIGRDNCQGLHQRQSKSVNPGQFITIATGPNIFVSNVADTLNVTNDRSFLVWGDNNAVLTDVVAVSGTNVTERSARVWRVDKTNWADQTITFRAQGYPNRYLLIHNTDGAFGSAPSQEIELDGNGQATFSSSLLPDGAYFTLGNAVQGPGCVNSGVKYWLKGDYGATATEWTDYSGNENHAVPSGTPALTGLMNFNPAFSYNNNAHNLPASSDQIGDYSIFGMAQIYGSSGRVFESQVGNALFGYWGGKENVVYFNANPNLLTGITATKNVNLYSVQRGSSGAWEFRGEGAVINSGASSHNTTWRLDIGGKLTYNEPSQVLVPEVVGYGRDLTPAEVQRVESYFALKYGLTLDQTSAQNYLASDGTTKMWDAAANGGFKYNIAGIGRDKCSQLHQKQSKSSNPGQFITIALGETADSTNITNPESVTNDRSFFVWADDNGGKTTVVAVSGVNATERMERVWKVDKTNWADQDITFRATGFPNRYLLIHNTSATFASAPDQEILLDENGAATFSSAALPDGAYFTIGSAILGPGCVNSGTQAWLRADFGVSAGNEWNDYSGNDVLFEQTIAGEQAAYLTGDASTNFNPALNFAAGDNLEKAAGLLTSAGGTVIAAVMHNNIAASWGDIYNQNVDDPTFGKYAGVANFKVWDNGVHTANDVPLQFVQLQNHIATYAFGNTAHSYSAYLDGKVHNLTHAAVPSIEAGIGYIGGENTGETWLGNIYEIAFYNRKLTPLEFQRAHSYLALKYGITLDQTTPQDYLAADGTTKMWDATANATFKYNIAGLGRDNCQALHQKQSRSTNPNQFITIALGASIAQDNASNTEEVTNDKSFLVWGDDNGSLTTSVAVSSPNVTERMTRVWRVDKTDWDDQNITFKASLYPNRYLLIHYTSATFATAADQEILLDANGQATFNSSLLPDGAYFTIGDAVKGPGCVNAGIKVWLRTDFLAAPDSWVDYSGNARDAAQATVANQPSVSSAALNFNPALSFDNTNDNMTIPNAILSGLSTGNGSRTAFYVGKLNTNTGQDFAFAYGSNAANQSFEIGNNAGRAWYENWGGSFMGTVGAYPANRTIINSWNHDNSLNPSSKGYIDGKSDWTQNVTLNTVIGTNPFYIGRHNDGGAPRWWDGFIGEVVVYNRSLTAAEMQRVNSYLALKYGITLDQTTATDYLAGDGTTKMWDATVNAAHSNDIAGIGRDNCQGLHQKQSKSVNSDALVTMGYGNTIASDNAGNTNAIETDKSFLVWGNDNGVANWQITEAPADRLRLTREWRVDETGTIGSVLVRVPDNGSALSAKLPGEATTVYLLVDDDGDFSDAAEVPMTLNTTDWEAEYDFSDGQYFTFATQIPPAPGCVVTNLNLWLKADAGLILDGSNVTNWTDQSLNTLSADQVTVANQPTLSAGGLNFNPGLVFDNTNDNLQIANSTLSGFPTGNASRTAFFVGNLNTNNGQDFAFAYGASAANQSFQMGNNAARAWYENWGGGFMGTVGAFPAQRSIINSWRHENTANPNSKGYIDGGQDWSQNIAALNTMLGTNPFYVGRHNDNGAPRYWDGKIGEIILYDRALTAAEMQRINSYLALKYGITLDQSTPMDYLAGDGATKMWDATVNATYKYNIAGLGRDECQLLHQKQSKSVNANQFITFALGSSIADDNVSNEETVKRDTSFFVWGDDNGSKTTVVPVTGSNVTERMTRVWRVDKTNWTDQQITFMAQGFPNRYLIISNNSATFATIDQEVLLDANGQTTLNSSAFPDGAYFTIGDAIKGPGCVNVGVKVWLRADQGTVSPTLWSDYSGQDNSPIGRGSATITDGAVNFNPAVTFAGAVTGEAYDFSSDLFTTGNHSLAVFSVGTGPGGTILSHGANVTDQAIYVRPVTPTASFDFPSRSFTRGSIPSGTRLFRNIYTASTHTRGISFNGNTATTNTVATLNWQSGGNGYRILGHDFVTGTNKYNGNLPEMAVYFDVDLTAAQIQRIESYFALKYGITLDQTTPQDYLAGDGTTKMWDATANATFKNNIAGIGRDNCQTLHQKQSKSSNASQFITFAMGTSIAADNASNSETIGNDKSFLVWGDDNGSLTIPVAVSGTNVTQRMTRVWRVDKTNWNDQEIAFKAQGYPNRYLLIHNTSATFATAPDQEIALDANGEATFNSSLLPDGAYFTIGDAIKGPGCVNLGVTMWYKPDYGITLNGSNIATWNDYSGNEAHVNQTTPARQPGYSSSKLNFNPGATFAGGTDGQVLTATLNSMNGNSPYTIFAVHKPDNTSSNLFAIGNPVANQSIAYHPTYSGGVRLLYHFGDDLPGGSPRGGWQLNTFRYEALASGTDRYIYDEGKQIASGTTNVNNVPATPMFSLGGYSNRTGAAGEEYDGDLVEFAVYNQALSASDRNRVESYFALKYGITLDQTTATDYVAGDGTTKMWDATLNVGYKNDIAGIGRDDCQALKQKQSQSVNADGLITMGLGNTIAADNASNSNNFAADKSFLVWGNDDGAVAWQLTEVPAANRMRITREWRVQETGTIGSVKVRVPDDSSPLGSKLPPEAYPVYLLVDEDGDFSSGAAEVAMALNGTDWEAEYDFSNGNYFTFSTEVPPAPGCVVPNLGLWLEADKGVTGNPTVTAWADQTLNLSPITVVGAPQITSSINFNPAIVLGAGKYFTTPNAAWLNPTSSKLTLFAVTKPTSAATNPIISKTVNSGWDDGYGMYGNDNQKIGFWEGNQTGTEPANVPHQVYPSSVPFIATGYYDTNQKVSVNGQAATSAVQTPTTSTSQVEIGFAKTQQFNGDYAEVIMYNDDIGAAARDKVESYLAVKYGITLAHDYFAGDGTLIWDIGGTGGYDKDIAGIGRDDCDLLNQKQSKSVNTSALITIGNGNTIEASNQANSSTFDENASFMLWGNNNGAVSWQVSEAPAMRRRITREWLVKETGTVGSVKIQVPDNGSSLATKLPPEVSTIYLLVDADGDFSSGATEVEMTLNGTDWEANFDFSNGQYFTFATNLPAVPGCIASNLTVWLDASRAVYSDAGITPAVNGTDNVQEWHELSGNPAFAANQPRETSAGDKPSYVTNGLNFNPVVSFGGANDRLRTPANINSADIRDVTNKAASVYIVGNSTVAADNVYMDHGGTGAANFVISSKRAAFGQSADLNYTTQVGSQFRLVSGVRAGSGLLSMYLDGVANGINTDDDVLAVNDLFALGVNTAGGDDLVGNIAEVIVYSSGHTAAEQRKIQSYLAIKYGIGLGEDYVSGSGSTLWDVGNTGGYDSDVAGIGRDDCSGLDQRQTKSASNGALIAIGNGNTIAATNSANSASFAIDNSFMLWGNNNGSIAWQDTEAPTQRQRLTREWLISESSMVGSVKLRVPDNSSSAATKLPTEVLSVYLLVDNDGDFSSGATEIPMSLNGTDWEIDYDFANGEYFTLGTETCAPIITTNPIDVTLCASNDATFTVAALGPSLTYQWQEDTGSGFMDISGATGTSYTKTATTGAMNGYKYRAVVTGACSPTATSTEATLTVNTPPAITTQPLAVTTCAGTDATFTVAATGTGLTYQWQEDSGSGFANIPGATSSSYTKFSTTAAMNGYQYQVVISGTCSPTATSNAVSLTIDTAPSILSGPANVTVCAGTDATFMVSATGTGLTYQWQENTGSGFNNIPGATSASYTKTGTTGAMDGYFYQVIVSGTCAPPATSSSVELTVNTPPAITVQPVAATVCEGSDATFTVTATGTALTYQWQEDSGSGFANIPGATSASYTKTSTTAAMNGYQYRVIISGTCSPAATSSAVLLTVNTSPVITTQPMAQTVCEGQNATFTVSATGAGLTYQWQEDTGSGFANIPGATSASYTKMSTTAAMNGYQYRVVVSGTCPPSATSTAVVLTVNTLPAITTQPSAITVCEGDDATFTVTATGTGLMYQWQEDSGSGFANIPGATSASYTKMSTTAAMNGYEYQVIVSGTCTPPVTSNAVVLTVSNAPAISTQPMDAIVCEGQDATFTVSATGAGLTYQWQEDTGSGFNNIPGATSASYTKTGTTVGMNSYEYRVVVSGACAPPATSTAATLTVNTLPAITTQPTAVTVCEGQDATFTVVATGTGLMYQWQENTGSGFNNIAGATNASYTKTSTTAAMHGYQYRVIVSGTCTPPVTSSAVALTVNTTPAITVQPMAATVCVGQDATFTVTATGTGLTYQWQEDTGGGFNNIPGATSASYTKTSTTAAMNGYQYQVIVSGTCAPAATSSVALLTINTLPAIDVQPASVTVCAGDNAVFTVTASGTGLTYQWQENTGSGFNNIPGATNDSYTKASTTAAMNGYQYRVIVSGTCAPPATSSAALLTVNTAPAITTQPTNTAVCAGNDATFTVVATGTGLTYQWQENTGSGFNNIPGATSTSYTKASTNTSMNGYQYRVIVSGICVPSVTSNIATLTVNTLPAITTQPSNVTTCEGNNAIFTVSGTGSGLTYQWQENTGSGFNNIPGATGSLFVKSSVTAAMNGYQYRVILSGTCPPPVTSNAVLLTVNTAPAITVQPVAVTVCETSNATFTVTATGTGLTYQWQEDSGSGFANISGATSASYTKTAVTAAMNGYQYQVIVSGACAPAVTSSAALLTVTTPPAITSQPVDVNICAGANAVFSVTTTGAGLAYQWQVNDGFGFVDIPGATSATYTKVAAPASFNGYQYRVIVGGVCPPPVTSNVATLTILSGPSIVSQPTNAMACVGSSATFSVVATGPGLSYQWQENTGMGFVNISGATSDSYTKTGITAGMNGYSYRVLVSGTCAPTVTSDVAILTVESAPAITTQPSSTSVCDGFNATFSVTATGGGLTYQWQENTGSGFNNIAGATSASYTIAPALVSMNGYQYRVVVSGNCSPPATSNAATLTVNVAPSITTHPADQVLCVGANAVFSVTATGPGLTYQWQLNTGSGFNNISGATSAAYTEPSVTAGMDNWQYRVIVSGICSPAATSNSAFLTVNTPPAIQTQPSPSTTCEGSDATFTVSVTGSGLTYQWQENTGSGFNNIPGATSASYTKPAVTLAMSGYTYRVMINGVCPPSVTSSTVALTVLQLPAITMQPIGVTLCEGANATFTVTATGDGLSYQWQENTGSGFNDISGATSASYTKTSTTAAMNGYQYRVVVSGTCMPPVTSSNALLTVNTAPAITTQPTAATVCEGNDATFTVVATGTGLMYQWQEDSGSGFANIPGATSASYTKTSTTAAMNGYQYQVIVSGTCTPPVTSTAVNLTVNTAPAITTQPLAATVCAGNDATFTVTATGSGLTYQWQENTGSGFADISGATSASYTKTATTAAMNGYQYRVVVSGLCTPAVTSSAVLLTVNTAPAVTTQPMSQSIEEGMDATFTVAATGTGLTYQWQEDTGSGFNNISGATGTSYTKTAVTIAMSGYKYRAIVSGTCPSPATSNEAILTVTQSSPVLAVKAILGGSYDDGTDKMKDKLRMMNLIPNAQPYNGSQYSDFAYAGTETIGAGVLDVTGDNAIVDWVLLELRDASNPVTIVARQAALIQRDGDVVSAADGTSDVTFTGTPADDYYVVIRHRNHLGVMTLNALSLSGTVTTVDFTNAATQNYQLAGPNGSVHAQQVLLNNKRALWSGNFSNTNNTGNRVINQGNDADPDEVYYRVLLDPGNINIVPNYIVMAYDRSDGNLDGNVIYQGSDSDADVPFFTVFLFPGNVSSLPNYIVYQQIP